VSSNGNGSDSQSPLNVTDASHAGHSGSGAVGTRPFAAHVVGHSQAVLSCASAAMSRVEREIDHLWRDSMKAEDAAMTQRLADVSHALRQAARLLEGRDAIG